MSKKPTRQRGFDTIGNAAMAAEAIAKAVTGRRRGTEGISIHLHVGDLFLIGFDEAIDAEEWGAREINNDGTASARGPAAKQLAEPERITKRRLSVRKGDVMVTADEDARPAEGRRRKPVRVKRKARSSRQK